MPDSITQPDGLFRSDPAQKVYSRRRWSDDWEERPYLYCDRMRLAAAPEIATAELRYETGTILQHDKDSYEEYQRLDLRGHFVKVELTPRTDDDEPAGDPITWYGVVSEEQHPAQLRYGTQFLQAFDLSFLLSRRLIDTSVIEPREAPQGQQDDPEKFDKGEPAELRIGRALAFNDGPASALETTLKPRGNRSAEPIGESQAYAFAAKLEEAEEWTVKDIAQYLMLRIATDEAEGAEDKRIQWDVEQESQLDALEYAAPTVAAEGRSVKQTLDDLIDRSRLTSYYLTVGEGDEESADKIKLNVFTFNKADIEFESSTKFDKQKSPQRIPANPHTKTLDLQTETDVVLEELRVSITHSYDVVRVRGARMGCVCTLQAWPGDSSTFVPDWSEEDEAAYIKGASEEEGFDELMVTARQSRSQAVRQTGRLARVYCHFRIPDDWDGKVGRNLYGQDGTVAAIPKLPKKITDEIDPETVDVAPFWLPGLRIAPRLPLLSGVNYGYDEQNTPLLDREPDLPDGALPVPRPPFVLIDVPRGEEFHGIGLMQQIDAPVEMATPGRVSNGAPDWRASVFVNEESPGLVIQVQGAPQHVIALESFEPLEVNFDDPAECDWETLRATVMLEADQYCEAQWPEDADGLEAAAINTLVIDVGGSARLDYIAAGTIVGWWNLENDSPEFQNVRVDRSNGGFIRDDRPRLQRMAQLAHAWYSKPRRAMKITYKQITAAYRLGDLIETIGEGENELEVDSVVTSIEYDLLAGTTTISTDFAQLDVRSI